MIQIQVSIENPEKGTHWKIMVNTLEREDATDEERVIAREIELVHRVAFEEILKANGVKGKIIEIKNRGAT